MFFRVIGGKTGDSKKARKHEPRISGTWFRIAAFASPSRELEQTNLDPSHSRISWFERLTPQGV